MNLKKLTIAACLIALVGAAIAFDIGAYLNLDYFTQQRETIQQFYIDQPFTTALIFLAVYIAVAALSLPGAAVMTLAGGAIFGLLEGTLLVSFASTIGATLAFLVSRTLLRDAVQNKFASSLTSVNQGIEKEGGFYLFGLRLAPLFPFFVVNLIMGLTPMKTRQFFLISQLGMLPGTIVFVNAGTQLAQLDGIEGIFSPAMIVSFILLAVFPLVAKKSLNALKARKVYAEVKKPATFDANMVVIGGGSAGLVSALIGAATKAKVILIEKDKMGGDCLNTGCVPSKALIRSAKMAHYHHRSQEYGLNAGPLDVDFEAVMERVQRVIKTIEPHDSIERFTGLGVECITGAATILDPYRVEVNGRIITTKNIIIATGARPFVPPIKGIEHIDYLTSDTLWNERQKPKSLLIMGGGPIGCEMAQSFQRLGVPVTQIDRMSRLMPREDIDVSMTIQRRFRQEGIDLKLNCNAREFIVENGKNYLLCDTEIGEERIEFDRLLLAVGRQPNTQGFGLENLNVEFNPNGTLKVNEYLQTTYRNIYACGDVAGPYQFTHTASHQAWYTTVNSLFGMIKRFKVDYSIIPWATFSDPEVARVGLNEQDAEAQGIAYEVTTYGIDDLDRAIADEEAHGFIKVLTVPGKDKILGVTIVGHHAGDLISEYIIAMKQGVGLNKILGTIHIYPTLAEANKFVAGVWKREHAPEWIMPWLTAFHRWQRKGKRTDSQHTLNTPLRDHDR